MQNKGFVRVFAILLTLVCVFYLSFSFVTRHYTSKAKEFAKGDVKVEQDYLDSLANEKVYFGNWTLKQCREMEISLGLDLNASSVLLSANTLMTSGTETSRMTFIPPFKSKPKLISISRHCFSVQLPPNKLPQARMT